MSTRITPGAITRCFPPHPPSSPRVQILSSPCSFLVASCSCKDSITATTHPQTPDSLQGVGERPKAPSAATALHHSGMPSTWDPWLGTPMEASTWPGTTLLSAIKSPTATILLQPHSSSSRSNFNSFNNYSSCRTRFSNNRYGHIRQASLSRLTRAHRFLPDCSN